MLDWFGKYIYIYIYTHIGMRLMCMRTLRVVGETWVKCGYDVIPWPS